MKFDLREFDDEQLEALATHYEERGFVVLTGLPEGLSSDLEDTIARAIGLPPGGTEWRAFLDPQGHHSLLPLETRKQISYVGMTPELAQTLLATLRTILRRVLGPLVQVSSSFHAQVKGAVDSELGYGGFGADGQYLGIQSTVLQHQDFTGATLPTSPSFAVFWLGLNTCPDWPMRLYPGSHKLGLICDRFFPQDAPQFAQLEPPVDVQCEAGTALLFNSLLLHGGFAPGPLRRVSCDLRFFPLCGFLPSEVHALCDDPLDALHAQLERERRATLRAPLLEALAFLEQPFELEPPPALSPLHWAAYLQQRLSGNDAAALEHFHLLVNTELGTAPAESYLAKWSAAPVRAETLTRARELTGLGGASLRNRVAVP